VLVAEAVPVLSARITPDASEKNPRTPVWLEIAGSPLIV
jgi:hypothetical protein